MQTSFALFKEKFELFKQIPLCAWNTPDQSMETAH